MNNDVFAKNNAERLNDSKVINGKYQEYERLNNSLLSLTTHFAQVQLRLKQIVQVSSEERETLLKELEEFAFQGCLEISQTNPATLGSDSKIDNEDSNVNGNGKSSKDIIIAIEREKQRRLIKELKKHLKELETYAYQVQFDLCLRTPLFSSCQNPKTGTLDDLPQDELIERQNAILKEVNQKLHIKYDLDKMGPTELKKTIDQAIEKFTMPFHLKERLCHQLKTQIQDLERYINYLHTDDVQNDLKEQKPCICVCPRHSQEKNGAYYSSDPYHHPSASSTSILNKALNMLGLFLLSFLECDATGQTNNYKVPNAQNRNFGTQDLSQQPTPNILVMLPSLLNKSVPQGPHWGNSRANLEIAISNLINTCRMSFVKSKSFVRKKSLEFARAEKTRLLGFSIDTDKTTFPPDGATADASFSTTASTSSLYSSDSNYTTNQEEEDEQLTFDEDCDAPNYIGNLITKEDNKPSDVDLFKLEKLPYSTAVIAYHNGYDSTDTESSDQETHNLLGNEDILRCVCKELAPRLLELLHHGYIDAKMRRKSSNSLISYISCFAHSSLGIPAASIYDYATSGTGDDENTWNYSSLKPKKKSVFFGFMAGREEPHFWDAIVSYYEIKGGPQFNRSIPKKLSQSFELEIVGQTRITPKIKLLTTIHDIILAHQPVKRDKDALYKAFINHALNQKLLVNWIRLIFRSKSIVNNFYQSWSYMKKTGFEDAFTSLDKLNEFDFNLPIDISVLRLKHMKDAF